jgi:flagellar secretion chaperone FliS
MYAAARRSPADRYQDMDFSSRVESATPHGLVAILYAELGTALEILGRAQALGNRPRMQAQHERAASILHALASGLDREGGGDLAQTLGGIYRQMQRRLAAARDGDDTAVEEVRTGVASLADAWSRIA